MIPIDLSGKVALVTGVGDDRSFAWYIAKALQAAGARLLFSVHPRFMTIVESFLERETDAESRVLPFGAGTLKVEKLIPCDVSFDTMDDVDEKTRNDRRYQKHGDYSIQGMMNAVTAHCNQIDVLIHSVAFSPEITKKALDTSRKAYLTALSISSYSLTAMLRAAQPLMENRPEGASALGLTYLGGDRVVPHYGGGMSTAKAALQIDAQQLASNLGPKNIRVNLISAGPYKSRAAEAVAKGPDNNIDKMIEYAAARSPLPRGITPEEVANAAVFLCSPLASGITGEVLYVDCGYNVMGV
jgi:enoyl-[acyl-carrier protein] reductase I